MNWLAMFSASLRIHSPFSEACFDLGDEFVIEVLYVDSRMVGKGGVADARVAEVSREENGTAEIHNLLQYIERG